MSDVDWCQCTGAWHVWRGPECRRPIPSETRTTPITPSTTHTKEVHTP